MKLTLFATSLYLLNLTSLPAADKIQVVSFSTVITEIAPRAGGSHVEVDGLVKPGVDPHEFEPTPSDMNHVSEAAVVLLSAKHMEGYVTKLKETGMKGDLVEVGDSIPLASHEANR